MVREWSIERDDRRLRELYPDKAKAIMPYIQEECDRMEYNGSRMYDEFPDKHMLQKICDRVYENVEKEFSKRPYRESERAEKEIDDDIFATDLATDRRKGHHSEYLRELIEVLLCHEMFSRRCRHNQCKRCRR